MGLPALQPFLCLSKSCMGGEGAWMPGTVYQYTQSIGYSTTNAVCLSHVLLFIIGLEIFEPLLGLSEQRSCGDENRNKVIVLCFVSGLVTFPSLPESVY